MKTNQDIHVLFDQLCAHLQQDRRGAQWTRDLFDILENAHESNSVIYTNVWIPLLVDKVNLIPVRFLEINSIPNLVKLPQLIPNANWSFCFPVGSSFKSIENLVRQPNLAFVTSLDFNHMKSGDMGLLELANSIYASKISTIIAPDNDISDDGIRFIANSGFLSNIKRINLRLNIDAFMKHRMAEHGG